MTILMAHNYYQMKSPSGENLSFESEAALLRHYGQEIVLHTRDNQVVEGYSRRDKLALAMGAVWSRESLRSFRELIGKVKPEIAHFQNIFPLISPSAYAACREAGVPVVQALRNYRLLCPVALLFRDGHVCEDCLGRKLPLPGIMNACYRDSLSATMVVSSMLTVHNMLGTWARTVDLYVTLSEFARQKFIQGGFPAERIVVKPNFVHPDPGVGGEKRDYALFVGRLSQEKGLGTLLSAFERLGGKVPLKIVGDGPLADRVAEAAERTPGLEWLGRRPAREVYDLMGRAKVLIFPPECYETFGRVVIEAYAKGTPVIASDIGAIAELVDYGCTGMLFKPGDPEDLAAVIESTWTRERELAEMGLDARREYEEKYTPERNYQMLMDIYALAKTFASRRN